MGFTVAGQRLNYTALPLQKHLSIKKADFFVKRPLFFVIKTAMPFYI